MNFSKKFPLIRTYKSFLSLLLCVALLLSACSFPFSQDSDSSSAESQAFEAFTDTLFRQSVSSDALSLNYSLANPENYGICSTAGGFTPISYDAMKNSAPEAENLLSALKQIDQSRLSLSEQILYDSLEDTLKQNLQEQNYLLFLRPLSPVTGIQAQLPVLLAEYTFDSTDDIENYFSLLESIPDYFDSILRFMERQAQEDMLPSKDTLAQIQSQCRTFVTQNGSRILISSFKKRIKSARFISSSERKKYRRKNKNLVNSCIVPAYTSLAEGMAKLTEYGKTDGSLSAYKDGKAYYEYLFAAETGSQTSPSDYFNSLKQSLENSKETLLSYAKKDASLFRKLSETSSSSQTPEQQLTSLSQSILADFPAISNVNFTVSYVDKSLEDYLSPAFYLTPPLDAFTENVIYINNSSRFSGSDLAPTLAHEGYPGHLYQNVYFRQQNAPLLSYALNFNGYTEGWATYAENYSYKYLGYSKDEVGILRNYNIVSLCIYGICDIGIHYYGWDEDKVYEFLNQNGSYSSETTHSLYSNIIDEPGSYLKYTIGFMEFTALKKAARQKFGDAFSELAFHKFVLSVGPAPFSVLSKYMDEYF